MNCLTDAEYLWEPVGDCWSVRKRSTGWVTDWEDPTPETAVVPPSAGEALAALERAVDVWRRDLSGLDDVRLWEILGSEGGNYHKDPVVAFVEHIHDEVIHHGAEVALLRDLYAHRPLHAPGA